jgi:histidinol dehydrogenase
MRILDTRVSKPEELARFLDKPLFQDNPEIEAAVRSIIADVRERGDAAVLDYVRKFDWPQADSTSSPQADSLVLPDEAIKQAYSQVSDTLLAAIKAARDNIERFHKKQLRRSWKCEENGKLLGQMIRPLKRAAVLAPAFKAPLPSSLLMAAVTAKTAGVEEIYVSTPPRRDGSIHPVMAVAAAEAGVNKIFRIGGAHGVAAFAYGTETVPKVDKIVGPGGVYVTMAKKLVFGQVGIDMLAGPSEVVVLADESANPRYVAADLLSQAEHDSDARAILLTDSRKLAEEVSAEVDRQLMKLSRKDVAQSSLDQNGAIILVSGIEEAIEMANRIAPEHLELAVADPMRLLDSIRSAGTVLMGEYSSEPLGDYIAGPNHILPTSGTARFSSPLNVDDFLKKSNVIMYSKEGLRADADAAIELAEAEGLDAHANAVRMRIEGS